jgi:hypothetical protein
MFNARGEMGVELIRKAVVIDPRVLNTIRPDSGKEIIESIVRNFFPVLILFSFN